MVKILFVCTGNMFRSASAEYALKKYITDNKEKIYNLCGFSPSEITIESAGTDIKAQELHKPMIDEFAKKGINVYNHIYMQIDKQLIEEFDLIVSMGNDHKKYLKQNFRINSPLFNKICYNKKEPILDDWENFQTKKFTKQAEDKYIRDTTNYICNSIPNFITNFKYFLK